MTPKISVVMAVYNTAKYLRRALDSVCNQTFRDLELICIDDGSTDGSSALLAEYAARDARIRVISHGKNRGVAYARNSGFDAAAGEVIGIVDSDDVIGRNFFSNLWMMYRGCGCDIVKGRMVYLESEGRWREFFINDVIKTTPLAFSWQWQSAIYSTKFVRKYNLEFSPEVTYGEDALFLYKLMGHEPQIAFTNNAIYYYIRNATSLTNAHADAYYLTSHIRIAQLLKEYLPVYTSANQRRKMFAAIIKFLDNQLNQRYAQCDWSPHLEEIKGILTDDQFYAPLKNFPFLRPALNAKNIQEVKLALKTAANCLVASSLRAALGVRKA